MFAWGVNMALDKLLFGKHHHAFIVLVCRAGFKFQSRFRSGFRSGQRLLGIRA